MEKPNAFLQLLGLVRRASKLESGEEFVLKAIRSNSVQLVIIASDTGQASAKKIRDKSSYYHIPLIDRYTKSDLSQATGMSRTAYGVKDPGFARKLSTLVNE